MTCAVSASPDVMERHRFEIGEMEEILSNGAIEGEGKGEGKEGEEGEEWGRRYRDSIGLEG